jgi:hypothetical protein
MADFDFFDQFGKKMRSLRPSSRTAGEDWQMLSQRLDTVMPQAVPVHKRWRLAAAALLLLVLGSNLWWGFTFRQQDRSIEQLSAEVAALKKAPATAEKTTTCEEADVLRNQVAALQSSLDEVTLALKNAVAYPPAIAFHQSGVFSKKDGETATEVPEPSTVILSSGQAALAENEGQTIAKVHGDFSSKISEESEPNGMVQPVFGPETERLSNVLSHPEKLPALDFLPLEIPHHHLPFHFDNDLVMMPLEDKKDESSFTRKVAKTLLPKAFSIGASGGWLYPLEPDMGNQTGYGYGLKADLAFSSQFSLSAEWGRVTLHYKALAQDAAIGLPSLPLPSPEHQFLEMDVSNQRLVFYGLGLRYKWMPNSSWHPFASLGWSGMKVSPFTVQYETAMAGSIYKDTHQVMQRSGLKNYARLGAGVEFPIGRRFDLSLEGYYLHAWRNGEPDLMGVRTGLNFNF